MTHSRRLAGWTLVWSVLVSAYGLAQDWPTYRHDNGRSGRSAQELEAERLQLRWTWESPQSPRPAWPGPARWDAYAKLEGLRSMREYDPVFHPVSAGGRVLFGSSADDSVYCLDLESGATRWVHTVGGPVRVAPAVVEGRVFFGSDDGYAYALQLASGERLWRRSAVPGARRVLHDGRLVSTWPVRSGVIVQDGTASFAASFLPWEESYLLSVDAASGRTLPAKEGEAPRWERDLGTGWTIEGPLLGSSQRLVAPQGRSAPLLFSRSDGSPLGSLPGGGGSFCLLTDDDQILHGPGNKDGWISASQAEDRSQLASYARGRSVVVDGDTAYLLAERQLAALDRSSGALLWSVPVEGMHSLIQAGQALIMGGNGQVVVRSTTDGVLRWRAEVTGAAHGLAVARGCLLVATDSGDLCCFGPDGARKSPDPGLLALDRPGGLDPQVEPAPILERPAAGLLDRFVFQSDQLVRIPMRPEDPSDPRTVMALGNLGPGPAASLPGQPRFSPAGAGEVLELAGSGGDLELARDFRSGRFPEAALTAMAQVRVDRVQDWGGLVSMAQDNGAYERGWMLGFRGDRFGLAVAGERDGDGLTWLLAPEPFEPGRWYGVVGRYDGERMSLHVNGLEVASGTAEAGALLYPDQAFYQVGSYRDKDEYFPIQGCLAEIAVWDRCLGPEEAEAASLLPAGRFPTEPVLAAATAPVEPLAMLSWGPRMSFLAPGRALVHFGAPGKPLVELRDPLGSTREVPAQRWGNDWRCELPGLAQDRLYSLRIRPQPGGPWTAEIELDTTFDLSLEAHGALASALAEGVRGGLPGGRGIMVAAGSGPSEELAELVPVPGVHLLRLGADTGEDSRARERRRAWLQEGHWGTAVSDLAMEVEGLPHCPEGFAAAVVWTPGSAGSAAPVELERVARWVRPDGGLLWLPEEQPSPGAVFQEQGRVAGWRAWRRAPLPGAGVWSHTYGLPDQSAFGGEALGGTRSTQDLALSWIGRPGPRFQSDRGNRKPSPLAIAGRLHVQGLHRILTYDAFSGTPLWGVELPELARFNLPRTSSNWCADRDCLYVAVADRMERIDGWTGELLAAVDVPLPAPAGGLGEGDFEWGYVARQGELLFGSAVPKGAQFEEWWGGEHWYDAKEGEHTRKVTSHLLFAMDPSGGETRWRYEGGRIVDATVVLTEGRVTFLEGRSDSAMADESGRLGPELWAELWMVCLDAESGEELWRRSAKPLPGDVAVHLASDGQALALATSGSQSHALYVFDASTGESRWRKRFDWEADHHGKHLARPTLVGGEVFLRPFSFDLATGEAGARAFPEGHQCGSYAASAKALFLRAGELCVWDSETRSSSRWQRLRPDCWISTIPGCGMLLSPEGGGGCSCGEWLEASMGFLPWSLTGDR